MLKNKNMVKNELQIGDFVKERNYGHEGVIFMKYKNWEDLKLKTNFLTIDSDDESNSMNAIEKLINGDPKDKWLDLQDIKFTEDELDERWYSVKTLNGGSISTCESKLYLNQQMN